MSSNPSCNNCKDSTMVEYVIYKNEFTINSNYFECWKCGHTIESTKKFPLDVYDTWD